MKIKKQISAGAQPAAGGAAIADRFKLENIESAPKGGTVAKGPTTIAFCAALLALGIIALLTFTLWKHWEFLMPA